MRRCARVMKTSFHFLRGLELFQHEKNKLPCSARCTVSYFSPLCAFVSDRVTAEAYARFYWLAWFLGKISRNQILRHFSPLILSHKSTATFRLRQGPRRRHDLIHWFFLCCQSHKCALKCPLSDQISTCRSETGFRITRSRFFGLLAVCRHKQPTLRVFQPTSFPSDRHYSPVP